MKTIYKPAGTPVFSPHSDPEGACVLQRLIDQSPACLDIDWPQGFDGGICHRLDNSTSGTLIVAETLDELAMIRALFSEHKLTKRYLLRARKVASWQHNTISTPIAHDQRRKSRMIVQRGKNTPHRGKWYPAETEFTHLKNDVYMATISTGVTHQIRVHAAFVGIPLLGDRQYGGGTTPGDTAAGVEFYLHHIGLIGPDGFRSDDVPLPSWAPAHAKLGRRDS